MAGWTTYGRQQLHLVGMGVRPAPTLYLALYQSTADPATGVELTLAGYARRVIAFVGSSATDVKNAFDITFGPMAAGAYQGLAVHDASTGPSAWMWNDLGAPITIPAASNVTFAASSIDSLLV